MVQGHWLCHCSRPDQLHILSCVCARACVTFRARVLIPSCILIKQDPGTRYPVVVLFNKVNYANVSTNNYALDEVELVV